jgi:hypothetical protein
MLNASSNLSFYEAKEQLLAMVNIAKKFQGFVVKPNLKEDVEFAANCVGKGEEREAVRLLLGVIRGIRNTLRGFFRGSPKYFTNLLGEIQVEFSESDGLDKDLLERAEGVLGEEESLAESQLEIDLELAAEVYCKAQEVLREVAEEQRRRIDNRRKRAALERIEANKAKEVARAKEALRVREEAKAREAERRRLADERSAAQREEEARRCAEKAKGLRALLDLI